MGLLDWFRKPQVWSIDVPNDATVRTEGQRICIQETGKKLWCYGEGQTCKDGEWTVRASTTPGHQQWMFACNERRSRWHWRLIFRSRVHVVACDKLDTDWYASLHHTTEPKKRT